MDAPFHSSGALSRRHYAIVKKVESATTTAAADQEIILEIKSLKNDIQDPRLSTARKKEYLIILLYCAKALSTTTLLPNAFEFAFFHAVNLAEVARTVADKRIGYLFCMELLPPGHDLRLMLVNTIRKDLESDDIPRVCLALDSLISSPTEEVAPAVTMCLKSLLSHPSHHIHRRALFAYRALAPFDPEILHDAYDTILDGLQDSDDPAFSASLALVNSISKTKGVRKKVVSSLNKVLEAEISHHRQPDHWHLQRILATLRSFGLSDTTLPILLDILHLISELDRFGGLHKAVLLEAFGLLSQASPETLITVQLSKKVSAVQCIRKLIAPRNPNDLHTFTSCLLLVPTSSWAGTAPEYPAALDDFEFGQILELLSCADLGIRTKALNIIYRVNPALLDAHYSKTLEQWTLPVPSQLALRLLEILAIRHQQSGTDYASHALDLIAEIDSEPSSSASPDVVSSVLSARIHDSAFRLSCAERFVEALVTSEKAIGATMMVIIVALVTEVPESLSTSPSKVLSSLASRLRTCPVNVRHVCVLAMLRIRVYCDTVPPEVTEAVIEAEKSNDTSLKLCCKHFLKYVTDAEELRSIIEQFDVSTLPDFFKALEGYAKKPKNRRLSNSTITSSLPGDSTRLRSPKLRYAAYEAPSPTPRLRERRPSRSSRHSLSSGRSDGRSPLGSPPMTAGNLTLAAASVHNLSLSIASNLTITEKKSPPKKAKKSGFDLISLGTADPFSPFEATGPDLAQGYFDFEELWNTIGSPGDARGWCSSSLDVITRGLQTLKGYHLRVVAADIGPFIGELKVLVIPDEGRAKHPLHSECAALRLKESEEDSCLWRLRCTDTTARNKIQGLLAE